MSNLAKIYTNATKIPKEVIEVPEEEDALSFQTKQNWKQSSVTLEFFHEISSRIVELEKQARELAANYHQHNNHQQIISLLTRANELRHIVNTYA